MSSQNTTPRSKVIQHTDSTPTLTQINVYPAKSVGGISLSNSWVEKQGLSFDRRFMIALSDGSMVTARKYPKMVKVKSCLVADGVMFTYPGMPALKLVYSEFKMQESPAQVWKDTFTAYTTTDCADDWFSQVLGLRVEFLFCGEQSNRVREKLGHNVSFADGYPVLIISQQSLDELNRRSPEFHSMDQFRTNLVVSGSEPFIEDSWKRIRIGEVEFEAVKPCERCILTTVDVEKGEFRTTKEPLNTLSRFRANERGGVFFGQNLVAKNEGLIQAGDVIEVLETKEKEFYQDTSSGNVGENEGVDDLQLVAAEEKALQLSVNGYLFEGNNQDTLLKQAENAGLSIMNSCRAGICGACMMTLESGKVDHFDAPAIQDEERSMGKILACCCVPKTDIEVID
ncbi:YcbX family protein [Vibrio cortegadensis]|uniref:YcbX family protein n=1 Tax=Vibrio cortegadensis TaxID=1328770 RepID=UPI00352D58B0